MSSKALVCALAWLLAASCAAPQASLPPEIPTFRPGPSVPYVPPSLPTLRPLPLPLESAAAWPGETAPAVEAETVDTRFLSVRPGPGATVENVAPDMVTLHAASACGSHSAVFLVEVRNEPVDIETLVAGARGSAPAGATASEPAPISRFPGLSVPGVIISFTGSQTDPGSAVGEAPRTVVYLQQFIIAVSEDRTVAYYIFTTDFEESVCIARQPRSVGDNTPGQRLALETAVVWKIASVTDTVGNE